MTIKVNTVPNANWHDAMFTQFAAHKTELRHPDPGLAAHRRGGDERQHPRPHRLRQEEHRHVKAYNPYLLAAYGQYPQAETGKRDENASLYGLPLLGDTWTMIYRKDLIGDKPPQTWDEMISVAKKCQAEQPRRQRAGLPPGQRLRRRGRDLQHGQRRLRRPALGRQDAQDRGRHQRHRRPEGDGRPGQPDEAAHRQGLGQLVHRRGQRGGQPGQGMHRVPVDRRERRPARPEAVDARHHAGSDPRRSWASPPCRRRTTNLVPLGGMGMHVSAYSPRRTRQRR